MTFQSKSAGSKLAPVLPPTPTSLFTTDASKDTLDQLETIFSKIEKTAERKDKPEMVKLVINRTTFDQMKKR